MSQARRARQQERRARQESQSRKLAIDAAQPRLQFAALWLSLLFLLPNLGALMCGFVFDDLPVLVENESLHVHSFRQLAHIWKSGYWPDNRGLPLYRPFTQTVWATIWALGGANRPAVYHAICLVLGLAVVLLFYRFLLEVEIPARTAFVAAGLFALFPIHTEATTSVVGSAELLASTLALAALLLFYRGYIIPAIAAFALAVFSKESAATFAAIPIVFPPTEWRSRRWPAAAVGAGVAVGISLWMHDRLSLNAFIPPIDNPMGLLPTFPRILTALWVQVLYVFKTIAPITLSSDYSYKQIPLVMGLADWRAWAGLTLAGTAVFVAFRYREFRAPILVYAILFSAAANVVLSIATIMGERLAYAPTMGIALLLAILIARIRQWKILMVGIALMFGARSAYRNIDWRDADHFFTKQIETSPGSAKSWYSYGALKSARGDDSGAIAAYDHAIQIFPLYSEAFFNRGNALVRLGRREEAMESYRQCLRFDPGHAGARMNLEQLEAGLSFNPPRKKM